MKAQSRHAGLNSILGSDGRYAISLQQSSCPLANKSGTPQCKPMAKLQLPTPYRVSETSFLKKTATDWPQLI
jgi:hypothetical protein